MLVSMVVGVAVLCWPVYRGGIGELSGRKKLQANISKIPAMVSVVEDFICKSGQCKSELQFPASRFDHFQRSIIAQNFRHVIRFYTAGAVTIIPRSSKQPFATGHEFCQ